jgi:hypothetical protein
MDCNYGFLKDAIAVITPVFATAHDVNSPKGQPDPEKAMDNENSRSLHLLQLPADSEDVNKFATGSITFIGTATVIIRYGALTSLTDPNFLQYPHCDNGRSCEVFEEAGIHEALSAENMGYAYTLPCFVCGVCVSVRKSSAI